VFGSLNTGFKKSKRRVRIDTLTRAFNAAKKIRRPEAVENRVARESGVLSPEHEAQGEREKRARARALVAAAAILVAALAATRIAALVAALGAAGGLSRRLK